MIDLTANPQGVSWAFVIFNFIAVFALSWLYLHGAKDLKRWFSSRKTGKAVDAST